MGPGNRGNPGSPGNPTNAGTTGPTTRVRGGMRPTTGSARRRASTETVDRWEYWWEYNKEPFLRLPPKTQSVLSGSTGFYTGRGKRVVVGARPTRRDVLERIVPLLEQLLEERDADIVDSSALALARILPASDAPRSLGKLCSTLGHRERTPREAAALAFGVLGSTDATSVLTHLLLDSRTGRWLTRRDSEVEERVRAFAAASLGLIGDPSAADDLMSVINDPRLRSRRDLQAMALLALGLMSEGHERVVPFLLERVRDRTLDQAVRAQAPVALGRLLSRGGDHKGVERSGAIPHLLELLGSNSTDRVLRQSLALALGMLGDLSQAEVIDALVHAVRKETDAMTRHFSIMALARIGNRGQDRDELVEAHSRLRTFFLRELTRPERMTHQPFAALGLAVYARGWDPSICREVGEILLQQFQRASNPSSQSAMAVALGLLDYQAARTSLWDELLESRDPSLRGYLALSVGLLRDRSRAAGLREMIVQRGLSPLYRLQLARALGLMGDPAAVPTLVGCLESSSTLAESSSLAQAIGVIREASALDELLMLASDRGKPGLQRSFGVIALGLLAQKHELPWNTVFAVDSNYTVSVPALREILDIL